MPLMMSVISKTPNTFFDFFKMDAAALAHGERGEIQDLRAENGVIIDEHVVVLQNFLTRQAGHGGDV